MMDRENRDSPAEFARQLAARTLCATIPCDAKMAALSSGQLVLSASALCRCRRIGDPRG